MASLDIPQISLVGVQGDAPPAPSPNNSSSPLPPLGHSLPNTQGFLSPPIPILRNSRNSLDIPSSPASHTSAASYLQPPPSPTLSTHSSGSIRWNSTVLRDSNPEEHDGLSSLGLLTPPWPMAATVSSIRSNFTEDSSGLGLRSGQPDTPNTHSSPNNPHVDAVSHPSRHSSPASFFKRAAQRVRHPSPSSSGDTDACSDTSRHNSVDSVQSGDNADIDRKRVELARPAVLDLKQEVDLNVEPFSFEPLQLAGLVDPKSLENLESLGGLEGLLHGLGSHPLRGLITKLTPPTESPDPATVHAVTPFGIEMSSPEPNIMNTSPTGVPEGLKSTASLGGGSSMGRSSSLKFSAGAYEATLEDRERIYGQNILPRRPSKSLLRLMWLALQDKVIVSPRNMPPPPCI
jgi:Ca2+-transporting ATPase